MTSSPDPQTSVCNSLIGICLVGETTTSGNQVVGAVYVPPETFQKQNLWEFREKIRSENFLIAGQKYVFLTSSGWEINGNLEKLVKLPDIVTSGGLVKICLSYSKPRLGIVIEGNPDVSVGFAFCDPSCKIDKFKQEIAVQLPALHSALLSTQFCFLDRNSWPISRQQEGHMTLLDIMVSHTVRIKHLHPTRTLSRKVSVMDDPMSEPEVDGARYSRSGSAIFTSILPLPENPNASDLLSPINELVDPEHDTLKPSSLNPESYKFEILLSYVHNEAGNYALFLKEALERLGYTVFLDIHCIQSGTDWQDVLNGAIYNCSLFVPLITMQYGETLWTNREVKLADVLGKVIIPVNFISSWPPKCLAIQFATTQFIPGTGSETVKIEEITPERFTEDIAEVIATGIADRYLQEIKSSDMRVSEEKVNSPVIITRQSTQILGEEDTMEMESVVSPTSAVLIPPANLNRRRSAIKSYASVLPDSLPSWTRLSMTESRKGKPLVVICCQSKQREFAQGLVVELQAKDYEVWCSCDQDESLDEEKIRAHFQEKADEAGVVVFILSKDFAECSLCKQQVYYCEQRKRIVPLIYEPIQLPNWMAMLIGTNTFVSCQAQNYKTTFMERIECNLNPKKAQDELMEVQKQKIEIVNMCLQLEEQLPKGKHVYISGGAQFFSECGKAICKELGKQLARDLEIILITGGFFGVGETVGRSFYEERERMNQACGVCHVVAVRDDQDKSKQTRQNPDGTFCVVPYGKTLFFGTTVRQREMLTPHVIDLCILIEGGPGAAFEAQQFVWNGKRVIPIKVTGGAAGGLFNIPMSILIRPPNISESDWSLLNNKDATPADIASGVVRIVQILKNPDISALMRSRSNTGSSKIGSIKLKRSKALISKRSETLPERRPSDGNTTTKTLKAVQRALSEKDTRIQRQNPINY